MIRLGCAIVVYRFQLIGKFNLLNLIFICLLKKQRFLLLLEEIFANTDIADDSDGDQ